jgi:hypothetical protein
LDIRAAIYQAQGRGQAFGRRIPEANFSYIKLKDVF